MSSTSDNARFTMLEKRVSELAALVSFQDSMRVKIEKYIGVIDQQLIKTDTGLHELRGMLQGASTKPKAKTMKTKTKPKTKTKVKAKLKPKKKK
jgi:hypothetical protein